MARRPISGIVRDGEGNIIASATVALTVEATALAATCYAAKAGGSALAGGATTSGTDGSYVFWVDDGDHAVITVFVVTGSKTGYTALSASLAS